jgi:magnesium transporter
MFRKRHPPAGSRPGTLVIHERAQRPVIRVMKYRPEHLEEHEDVAVADVTGLVDDSSVCWIDVCGLGDEGILRSLAAQFSIHPLALEDVVNVPQRPKIERFSHQTLFITRMVALSGETIERQQVSLVFGRDYVITFLEHSGDVFDPVRARIRQGGPVLRHSGTGYLVYALLDSVLDGYYPILEEFGERLESLEDEIVANPRPDLLPDIHHAKRDLLGLRRAIWPQREALNGLIRGEDPYLSDSVRVHLRDCYDHCIQIIDAVEMYRELTGGLMDVHLSSVANRQNEVMKVLTIMASIFIPLSFMAGVYGMNFEYMPELHWWWGYPCLLMAMAFLALMMILYFRRKGWFGAPEDEAAASHRADGTDSKAEGARRGDR